MINSINCIIISESDMTKALKNQEYIFTLVSCQEYINLVDFTKEPIVRFSYEQTVKTIVSRLYNYDNEKYEILKELSELNECDRINIKFDLYHDFSRKVYILTWK